MMFFKMQMFPMFNCKSPNTKNVNLVQSPGTIVSESEVLVKGKVEGASVSKTCNVKDW